MVARQIADLEVASCESAVNQFGDDTLISDFVYSESGSQLTVISLPFFSFPFSSSSLSFLFSLGTAILSMN